MGLPSKILAGVYKVRSADFSTQICRSDFVNTLLVYLLSFLLFSSLHAASDFQTNPLKNQLLYLIHCGDTVEALNLYNKFFRIEGQHDFELLQQLSFGLIRKGYQSRVPEDQLLSIFGAGISMNEHALPLLEEGFGNANPQIQLASLNFLSRFQNDEADLLLQSAMSSPYVLIRLEAAHYLAKKKHKTATGQLEALMAKVDAQLKPLFPPLFLEVGDPSSTKIVRQLLHDPSEIVRIETILALAQQGRDDLLPQIRLHAAHPTIAEQEACALALGVLKDATSMKRLEMLARSASPYVQIAAWHALVKLGDLSKRCLIEKRALQGDIFAISALASIEGSEEILVQLINRPDLQIRFNAAIALLERHDCRCMPVLYDLLLHDARDLALTKIFSPGRALSAYRVIPSAQENLKDNPFVLEMSMRLTEALLRKTLDLPEQAFLEIANTLFIVQQPALIPTLVELLENLHTPAAVALLQRHEHRAGAPLIRYYCILALFRMNIPGPYAQLLRNWVAEQQDCELIRFRPFIPVELCTTESRYQLTPEEKSRLLIESLDAIAKSHEDEAISLLLSIIQKGNPKNQYALAGLLIHATQ